MEKKKELEAVPDGQKVPENGELLLPTCEGKPKKPACLPNCNDIFPASSLGIIKHLSKERLSRK